jgi:two-component sensor histidine kinase
MRVVLSGVGKQQLDSLRELTAAGVRQHHVQITAALQRSSVLSARIYLLLSALAACALVLVVIGMLLMFRNVGLEAETSRLRAVEAAERETQLVARELSHRVKNLFSVVLAIVRLGARGASTPAQAIGAIQSRIQALARAHEVSLGQDLLQSADLGALLRATLSPYDRGESNLELVGPPLKVPVKRVTPLGMIMHELATNAVKYGAWRSPAGKVVIRWGVGDAAAANGENRHTLHLEWEETCEAPIAKALDSDGFGSRLIQAAVLQLEGRFEREARPQGMRITLDAPIAPAHQGRD